jgi:CRP-like cAMP-binding protein
MLVPAATRQNRLLGAITTAEYDRLALDLELVHMPAGFVIYDTDIAQRYAYFPVDALISIQCVMRNGCVGETAIVGNEGMVGVSIFMGGQSTPGRAVVKCAGVGYRVKASVIRGEFDRAGSLMRLMLRYTQALLTQVSQTAVCNRHHSINEQLCRGLLLSLDLIQVYEFAMTHELIAKFLGVRREGITECAGRLQKAGRIRYHRGMFSVIDREGLLQCSCECYAVIHAEYRRLLPRLPLNALIARAKERKSAPSWLLSSELLEKHSRMAVGGEPQGDSKAQLRPSEGVDTPSCLGP